jgi:hypothetical protein
MDKALLQDYSEVTNLGSDVLADRKLSASTVNMETTQIRIGGNLKFAAVNRAIESDHDTG